MRQWSIHVVLPSIAAAELALDVPDGFLTHGAIGFWQLVISLLALQLDLVPVLLAYLRIVAALLNWLTIFGYMLATVRNAAASRIWTIGIGLGSLVSIAWFAWLGISLLLGLSDPNTECQSS